MITFGRVTKKINAFAMPKHCIILCLGIVLLFTNCAKQKKKEEMSFDELRHKAFACLEKKHRDEAAEYLEQIIAQNPDRADIAKYKLLLAEVYFKTGKYPSAFELYDHYNQFYPADARAEYAKYRSILAKFYQTLRTDCDQTQTEETVKLCQEYLENPTYKNYATDVSDISKTCEYKLIDKEVYVFNFYLKQGEYEAAKGRLNHLREAFAHKNPRLEARLLYLESQLAQKQKNLALIKENIEKLSTKFPESQFTPMTQALLTKQSFLF
jgi:outer membrane protein assembly factor BamD